MSDAQTLQGVRVLVIDDNHDAADVMALLLEDMGAVTQAAYDGAAGLAAMEAFGPAVVLLDVGMPGMDGYETCRRIRARWGAAVGVVALTGWSQEQDKKLTQEAGFDIHLTKPTEPADLERAIRTVSARLGTAAPRK